MLKLMKPFIIISVIMILMANDIKTFAQTALSLSQEQCREMALQHNEALQQADNELKQAELDKAIAFTAYLPKFEGTATVANVFEDIDMMGMELRMKGMYMAGISLIQPIYAGGKIMAGNRLARLGTECAAENRRKTRMEVIADADNAYWTYIATLRKIEMLQTYSRQMDTLLRQIESSVSAKMATENDRLRIQAKQSEINYQLQKVQNGANLCRLALCNVIGASLDTEITPADSIIQINAPERLEATIEQRPELRLLQKQVEVQQQQIKTVRADMLPSIGFSLGYTYYGNIKLNSMTADGQGNYIPYTQKFRDGFTVALASVNVPIFHWRENVKKVRKSELQLKNSELELQRNTRLLTIEAQQAKQNVTEGYMLIETAETGLQQAQENLRVMQERFRVQMATLTDLLDAQSQWQQAASNRIEAMTQYKIYETEFLKATGQLD